MDVGGRVSHDGGERANVINRLPEPDAEGGGFGVVPSGVLFCAAPIIACFVPFLPCLA
jgi:hypothetical protein